MSNNAQKFMGTERLCTLLPRLAAPMMLAQLLSLLYNVADRIFIGHAPGAGTDALAGIGICFPLIGIVIAFANWAGAGAAPRASMALGAGNIEEARGRFSKACWMLCLFAVCLLIVYYAFMEPLLTLFGCSAATLPYGIAYMRIYALSIPLAMVYLGLNPFLLAQGDSKWSLASFGVGDALNLVLDYLLIMQFGLGVEGAAIASVISQGVSAVITICALCRKKSVFRPRIPQRPSIKEMGDMLLLGSGPFFVQATEQLLYVVMNLLLLAAGGDNMVAVYTVYLSVLSMAMMPTMGFTQGVQPVISYCLGAGLMSRVRRVIGVCLVTSWAIGAIIALPGILFPQAYMGLFSSDATVVQQGAEMLPMFLAGMLIFGAQLAEQSAFMGMGKGASPLIVATVRKFVLMIPLAVAFSIPAGMGAFGVMLAEPVSDIGSVIFASILFYATVWRKLPKQPATGHTPGEQLEP